MKKVQLLIMGMAVVLFSTSCKKFLDINVDPDAPTDVPAELLIPSAEVQIAASLSGDFSILGGIWAQHWAQANSSNQYRDEESYNLNSSDYNRPWRDLYSDVLIDLNRAKANASSTGEWNSYLISTALQAYTYQILVDYYDKIPFTTALQGEGAVYTPTFEDGPDVYDGVFALLDDATSKDFDASTVKQVPTDYLFGGLGLGEQVSAWKAFANALRMKMYLRQYYARTAASTTGLTALYNAYLADPSSIMFPTNDVTGLSDAAITQFEDQPGKSNPLYETDQRNLNTQTNIRGNNTFITFLQEAGDVRIDVFFIKPSGAHRGLPAGGYDIPTTVINPATISQANIVATTPFWFFSEEEVHFMLAETALRLGRGAGEVEAHYNAGVTAAFGRYGIDASSYISGGGVYEFPSGGSFEDQLKAIITQKWIGHYYQGYEAYFDFLRTGYPEVSDVAYDDPAYVPGEFTYPLTGTTSGLFPRRLIFPDIEIQSNPNVPTIVPITAPVWWDVD